MAIETSAGITVKRERNAGSNVQISRQPPAAGNQRSVQCVAERTERVGKRKGHIDSEQLLPTFIINIIIKKENKWVMGDERKLTVCPCCM